MSTRHYQSGVCSLCGLKRYAKNLEDLIDNKINEWGGVYDNGETTPQFCKELADEIRLKMLPSVEELKQVLCAACHDCTDRLAYCCMVDNQALAIHKHLEGIND